MINLLVFLGGRGAVNTAITAGNCKCRSIPDSAAYHEAQPSTLSILWFLCMCSSFINLFQYFLIIYFIYHLVQSILFQTPFSKAPILFSLFPIVYASLSCIINALHMQHFTNLLLNFISHSGLQSRFFPFTITKASFCHY